MVRNSSDGSQTTSSSPAHPGVRCSSGDVTGKHWPISAPQLSPHMLQVQMQALWPEDDPALKNNAVFRPVFLTSVPLLRPDEALLSDAPAAPRPQ